MYGQNICLLNNLVHLNKPTLAVQILKNTKGTVISHRMKYAIPACPSPGAGVHPWLMRAAWACRAGGLKAEEAVCQINRIMTRPPNPPREIEQAVEKVYNSSTTRSTYRGAGNYRKAVRPTFRLESLISLARKLDGFGIADLEARSPIFPEYITPAEFLRHLYTNGEKTILFTSYRSQGQGIVSWSEDDDDIHAFEDFIRSKEGKGAWFLANPVDGLTRKIKRLESSTNPEGKSRRCEECVTSFRYLVLESDQTDPAIWLAALVQLPLPIVSITSSGGKSLHALVRIDAESGDHWREIKGKIAPALVTLGADDSAMTAVRLTRLPQCFRAEKDSWQTLYYLNPTADETPIAQLPIV
jgi:hypothetical protein